MLAVAALTAALATTGDPGAERAAAVVAWIVGAIIALGALATALTALVKAARTFGRWVRRVLIPWIKSAIRLVGVLSDLPQTLAQMQRDWAEHIALADRKASLLDAIDQRSQATASQVGLILGEVKNNGGSSAKDSLHRIETALGLPDPPKTPAPAGTGPIPTAAIP